MFAVIFEVQPKPERRDEYLALAGLLKPVLERIDGFIDNERFASLRTPGRLLSLSTWRDEKSVVRWRTHAMHHSVQEKGRLAVFADYHLRVGEIAADSDARALLAQQRLDETETGAARAMTISELAPVDGRPACGDLVAALGRQLVQRVRHVRRAPRRQPADPQDDHPRLAQLGEPDADLGRSRRQLLRREGLPPIVEIDHDGRHRHGAFEADGRLDRGRLLQQRGLGAAGVLG